MRLLVVDDERELTCLLKEYFQNHGWAVTHAQNGDDALRILEQEAFDVVLSDLRMPGASGVEVLRAVRQGHPFTQVILMTGYRDIQSAIEAVNQGAFAYLEKPFSLSDLHERLQEALSLKQRREGEARERRHLEVLVGQKEEELSLLKERSRAILSVIPSMLVLVDGEGRIRDVNAPFKRAFPKCPGGAGEIPLCEGLRCPLARGGPCSEPCQMWEKLQAAIQTGHPSDRFTLIPLFGRCVQWERPTYQMLVLPLPHSRGGPPAEFLIVMDDVSREKAMEMQILHASRLASLGEMATGIVHELSQPLNDISVRAQLLTHRVQKDGGLPPEEICAVSQKVTEGVFRIAEVLQHLRVYARAQACAEACEFNPMELVEGSLQLIRTQMKSWGISLVVEPEEPLLPVRGKLHELQHALTNVLLNARDALREKDPGKGCPSFPDGKEIRITVRSVRDRGVPWTLIEVRDNGAGMAPEVLDRAFDPLFSTRAGDGGSGLGLPIAAALLREAKGVLRIETCPGEGTLVAMEIPAAGPGASIS
jgi:signal transduction histidine kinase/CheY-like chemotaxis protein